MTRPQHAPPLPLVLAPRIGRDRASALVRKLEGLAYLGPSDVAALEEAVAQSCAFAAHVDLVDEGEAARDVLIVLEGFACRYKLRRSGARQITAYLLPGDICADDGADTVPLDHAVGTLSSCVVARIPRPTWAELLERHPRIAHALRLAQRVEIETARAWIVNLGCRSAPERVAHLFCELMTRMEAIGLAQDGSCPLPITQTEVAQTLGLSNVHVNRTLQELRRQGMIEWRGRRLTFYKPQRVRDLGEFNGAYLQPRLRSNGHTAF